MIMTYREAIDKAVERLSPAVMERREALANVRLALMSLKSWSQIDLAVKSTDEISDFIEGKLESIVDRLLRHEPIQYILGYADFYGLKFKVTPDVLIPRPETAELVDMIVSDAGGRNDLRVLDICTGSGCIAIALARNLPFSHVKGIDISDKALEVAKDNSVSLHTKVDFIKDDALGLSAPAVPLYDIIVSNPPYIAESERKDMDKNVLDFEPSMALFVPDDDPLRFYKAISAYAGRALVDSGRLYFEINPLFADQLSDMLKSDGWADVTVTRDIHGRNRFMSACRQSDN